MPARKSLAFGDADVAAEAGEPQRQRGAGRTAARDQHLAVGRALAHASGTCVGWPGTDPKNAGVASSKRT